MSARTVKLFILLVIAFFIMAESVAWGQTISVTELGSLGGGNSFATGMNDLGQIVGGSVEPSGFLRAFLWTAQGGMVDLGTLGGETSEAHSINDRGQVVGQSATASDELHAFLWTAKDGMVDLATLEGNYSNARVVNNQGHIMGEVGEANTRGQEPRAVLWSVPSLTPEEEIKALIKEVGGLIRSGKLRKWIGNTLICELQAALKKLKKEKDKKACRILHSFTQQIEFLVKTRRIPSPIGDSLIQKVGEISVCQPLR